MPSDIARYIEPGMTTERVPIAALAAADSPRESGEAAEHIRTLAEIESTPPIVVHRSSMRVIDGMHRLRAAKLRGADHIDVRYFEGSAADAFVLAVKLNIAHGLPLSHTDRVAAATRIIDTHAHWSDRWVATVSGLSPATVAVIRRRSTSRSERSNVRLGLDGRARPVNAAERRMRASKMIAERPDASLREIAGAAGISVATAKDVRDRMRDGAHPLPPKLRAGGVRPARRSARRPDSSDEARRTRRIDLEPLVGSLRMDPSMRNESGRFLIQSLRALSPEHEERWRGLVHHVPRHRVDAVARLARECADHWQWFADQLARRAM